MSTSVAELINLLELERIEVNLYRGRQPTVHRPAMFGGQVLGQALAAAFNTVPAERIVHSLHAYFILAGDTHLPVLYQVEQMRDGSSFTTRRVSAIQDGRPIFHLTASFQIVEPGPDHQDRLPPVTAQPDSWMSVADYLNLIGVADERVQNGEFAALEVRINGVQPGDDADAALATAQVWMKTAEPMPDDPRLHCCALAYMSDLTLLGTSLRPHLVNYDMTKVQRASLDHAMWFHRPVRADQWLLYDQVSPSASGARGLSLGRIFDEAGRLVVTVAQEGLIRPRTR